MMGAGGGRGQFTWLEGSIGRHSFSLGRPAITGVWGAFTHLGRWVIFPPNAPVLGHVFWKHFRKFLNQQAFKFLQTKIAVSKKIQDIDSTPPPTRSKEAKIPTGPPKGMEPITRVSAVKVVQGHQLSERTIPLRQLPSSQGLPPTVEMTSAGHTHTRILSNTHCNSYSLESHQGHVCKTSRSFPKPRSKDIISCQHHGPPATHP